MNLLNKKGFSLVEALAGFAMLSATAMVMLSFANNQRLLSTKNSTQGIVTSLRENILNTIVNQASWDRTIASNSTLSCLATYPSTCVNEVGGDINIHKSDGTVLVDSLNPNAGFTLAGVACSGYSPQGNDLCPLKVHVSWRARCLGIEGCQFPQEIISVRFDYSPKSKGQVTNFSRFNIHELSRRNLSERASPMTICSNAGQIYIGIGNVVQNGQGVPTLANANGCVPVAAFTGARGAQGPTGPRGAPGPNGVVVSIAAPIAAAPPLCSANPWICSIYNSLLGRNPEVGGNTFWEGQYANCLSGGTSAAQCQSIVTKNIGIAAIPELTGDHETGAKNEANWIAATGQAGVNDECLTGRDCKTIDPGMYLTYQAYCEKTGKCR